LALFRFPHKGTERMRADPGMTPQISIEQVVEAEREMLWRYLQLYIYDMSRFTGAQPD